MNRHVSFVLTQLEHRCVTTPVPEENTASHFIFFLRQQSHALDTFERFLGPLGGFVSLCGLVASDGPAGDEPGDGFSMDVRLFCPDAAMFYSNEGRLFRNANPKSEPRNQ